MAPSHRQQLTANFCSMSPPHRQHSSQNCCGMGLPSTGAALQGQAAPPWQRGPSLHSSPTGSQPPAGIQLLCCRAPPQDAGESLLRRRSLRAAGALLPHHGLTTACRGISALEPGASPQPQSPLPAESAGGSPHMFSLLLFSSQN